MPQTPPEQPHAVADTRSGSAAPRLRRVVRAAASETGKRARLQLRMAGSSDQLDRNVLERITAPLEHMLRNAVVHGIEAPRDRTKSGKQEEGEITVTVEAEATEFVLRVEDDGNGVNLDAVRKRAIERGLMKKNEDIAEQRLTEFNRVAVFDKHFDNASRLFRGNFIEHLHGFNGADYRVRLHD